LKKIKEKGSTMPKSSQKVVVQEGESQCRYTYRCIVIGDKLFKNQKQYEMFVRLHRKKCVDCVRSNPKGNNTKDESLMYDIGQDLQRAKKAGSNQNLHAPESVWAEIYGKMGVK